MAGRLTNAEYLAAWRVDGELAGHTPEETIGFVSALMDLSDEQAQRALPAGFVSPDLEPKWVSRLRRLFGR